MNKAELISAIAAKTGTTKKEVEATLKAFCDVTVEAVKANDKVTLPGFGTFDLTVRAEREGINPSTKEKMTIHESKSIHYKMASGLKSEL